MTSSSKNAMAIKADESTLSPLQKIFNNTIKKLQKKKKELQAWEDTFNKAMQINVDNVLPIESDIAAKKLEILYFFDDAHEAKKLTPLQKKKLSILIINIAQMLFGSKEHEKVEAIFNKHAQKNYKDHDEDHKNAIRDELEFIFDIDLGDDFDLNDPESFGKAHKKIFEKKENTSNNQKGREKTKQQIEKEKKQEEDNKSATQSIKEVYRQLAKALHPDREMDEKEKERKHDLMQRANVAYKKEDLLALLSLQLEIEQIDQNHIDNLATERLMYFNKILAKQCADINHDMHEMKMKYAYSLDLPPHYLKKPIDLIKTLDSKKYFLLCTLEDITDDLNYCSNTKQLKKYINRIQIDDYENF
jgi:hypothetical protein